jgi:hypothetical protein
MIETNGFISATGFKRGLVAVAPVACLMACLMAASPASFAADPANDIAEKFSRDADAAATKARAQASAERKEAARVKAAEDQRKAEEQEMLATARREADDRKRAEALAEKSGTPTRIQIDANDLEQQRKIELERVATKLRLAREARESKLIAEAKRAAETAKVAAAQVPPPRAKERDTAWTVEVNKEPAAKPDLDTSTRSALGGAGIQKFVPDTKVTVLMVLAPGNKGIRRLEKTADPVLCTDDGCYISQGANAPARQKAVHKTLGIGNTFGRRAGECNHSLGCVFRGVDVGNSGNYLQAVDLKMMIHDRRARLPFAADSTCRVASGTLICGKPLVSDDYMLWVVPESIATEAGPDALTRAIASGLAAPRATDVGVAVRR